MIRSLRGGLLGLAILVGGEGGCGGSQRAAATAQRAAAVVLVQSNVKDAQLFVDGRFVSTLDAARGGVAVSAGPHRFELRSEDYFSAYLELDLERSEHKKVSMPMAVVLP